jgi:hypothetical protein
MINNTSTDEAHYGSLRASVMSLAAIKTLSVDEICGMGELLGGNSNVSTIRSLAGDVIYTCWHL